jgi:hypothetical protein
MTVIGDSKCRTTKGVTIECENLESGICSSGLGNIKNDDCILDGRLCVKYYSCSELGSTQCESVSPSLIKDGPCTWIKVFIFIIILCM